MVVPQKVMEQVYEEAKTPFKHGIVLRAEGDGLVDCPSVFRHARQWYMMYAGLDADKTGYQTYLATSPDLLTWRKLGVILPFRRDGWDAWQADGGVALQTCTWGGSYELGTHGGKFWASYIGGAKQGYEPDPLSIGLAWTLDPTAPREWTRLSENPVLAPQQADARPFEARTLYKSNIIRDESRATGYEFVMFYNGKAAGKDWTERIGMAVSDDMVHWQRYGDGPVIDNGRGISGDPQMVQMKDVWVMFYFGAFWRRPDSPSSPGPRDDTKAFDTFACSYDLVHWTTWDGPHLIAPSEPWDATFAHKPWVVKHDGVVYHFYCAVGDQGRQIALATSVDLR
ncbi:MAG: glycosylase [Phycisphaerae bacterium]|nr:glycosylase [Phycisphaerae bacterium]